MIKTALDVDRNFDKNSFKYDIEIDGTSMEMYLNNFYH